MPVANYDEIFAGYSQAPGVMSGPAAVAAHTEVAIPGVQGSFGGQIVAPPYRRNATRRRRTIGIPEAIRYPI